jgi:NADH-quinone oxidoreductase subunit B
MGTSLVSGLRQAITLRAINYLSVGSICCADEVAAVQSSRYDWRRLGLTPAPSAEEADLLFICGAVTRSLEAPIKHRYDRMREPKWVLAVGACASTGGIFMHRGSTEVVHRLDQVVPVDLWVPGCPPRPEVLIEAILNIREMRASIKPAGGRSP